MLRRIAPQHDIGLGFFRHNAYPSQPFKGKGDLALSPLGRGRVGEGITPGNNQTERTILTMSRQEGTAWKPARAVTRLMVGNDLEKARKRMRNAWIAGFVWAGWSFIGIAVALIGRLTSETVVGLALELLILAIVEIGLIAFLSYRVMQRSRSAATLLFFYFWMSRVFWIAAGLIRLDTGPYIAGFLLVQVLPAYLFFQGMRGAWTFHHLTHPQYPATGLEQKMEAPASSPRGADKNPG
jgi:hypothetical protein